MKIKFYWLVLVLCIGMIGCVSTNTTYQEFDEPCYQNQQPSWSDDDYYLFDCDGQIRRVRRTKVVYVDYYRVPKLTRQDRQRVYERVVKRNSGSTTVSNMGARPTLNQSTTTTSNSSLNNRSVSNSRVTRPNISNSSKNNTVTAKPTITSSSNKKSTSVLSPSNKRK